VFLGVASLFIFGMLPDLLTLFKEELLIASLAVIMKVSMTKAFLKWLFSKWFFAVYFGLSASFLIASFLMNRDVTYGPLLFQTLGLMSGSDPFTFRSEIEPHVMLWILAWLIHVASWLLIPALIAIIIAETKEEIMNEKAFVGTLGDILRNFGRDPKGARELREILDEGIKKLKGDTQ
jgi:hypothetical protein